MKQTIEVRKAIAADAARAWSIVRTGENVHLWFPAITSCRREGDKRHCTMAGGGDLHETITGSNDATRTFSYVVEKHPLPVGTINASMQVREAGAGRAEIIWWAEFEGEDTAVAQAARTLEDLYAQGIDSLEAFACKAA